MPDGHNGTLESMWPVCGALCSALKSFLSGFKRPIKLYLRIFSEEIRNTDFESSSFSKS